MKDEPVRLPDHIVDELFRAAMRCVESTISVHIQRHDGVECFLVPMGILRRLMDIVHTAERHVGDWRP